jgi:crotonobetainyl-CoA:carnitine CoA-transferase CaiB-like acyl-CoA transferase
MVTTSHPALGGTYRRYAPVIALSDTPSQVTTFCELGEHTRSLLAEHGYDTDAMSRLAEDGVVAVPAELTSSRD